MSQHSTVNKHSPAKINWFLTVTGKREDQFHELFSLVCPLAYGDHLRVTKSKNTDSSLVIQNAPQLQADQNNLILQADRKFRKVTQTSHSFDFVLDKKIPMGAGLGGGSSNASTALLAMNELCGEPLSKNELSKIAASIGSDCPLFLETKPSIMRGRGEIIEAVPESVLNAFSKIKILLWKPEFSIFTPWAYQSLARSQEYTPSESFEKRISTDLEPQKITNLLFNSFEQVAFRKFIGLEQAVHMLRKKNIPTLLSGSGSACFSIVSPEKEAETSKMIKSFFGPQSVLAYTDLIL